MRKKLLWLTLLLGVILATQVTSVLACHKSATLLSTGDGDMIIEVGEVVVWEMEIYLRNLGQFGTTGLTWTNIVVKDQLAAELEVDLGTVSYTQGTVDFYLKKGKMSKWYFIWEAGDLAPGDSATLTFNVYTGLNPAGKQEYTSNGTRVLNSGAVYKFRADGTKYSDVMPGITIEVLPKD